MDEIQNNPAPPGASSPGGAGNGPQNQPQPQAAAPRLGQRRGGAGRPQTDPKSPSVIQGSYRERLDQLRMEIMQISSRNMDNMLRNLRRWMAEK